MAGEPSPRPARQWGSVRLRTTVAVVALFAAAAVAGSVVLLAALRTTLEDDVRAATRLRAEEIAATVAASGSPPISVGEADEQFVQVLAPGGQVVAASDNVAGLEAITELPAGTTMIVDAPIGDDRFVVAAAAAPQAGELTVVVGRALDNVEEATSAVAFLLAVAGPALLTLAGLSTWMVVGRALAPVDAMRQQVDAISSSALGRRVPVPAGNDEITRLAVTMNRMLDRLEDGHRRQQRFIADASHELRSPVTSIRHHAEVAQAHPDRTDVPALAGTVGGEARRMQRLVDDLLLLARVDERGLELRLRDLDLDDIVFDEAARLRAEGSVRVDTRAVSAARCTGDERGLRRVVRNLADNARRHAATTVAFSLAEHDGQVDLLVDDDGPGIPPADRQRVLERFVRLDEGRGRTEGGAGLGLAIVREIVAGHGGRVDLTESPLGGTRVALHLPVRARSDRTRPA
jgi:signal transduction histidine kinase